MSVEKPQMTAWSQPGDTLECPIDAEYSALQADSGVGVRLEVNEVLEQFESRRVLVASAVEFDSDEQSLTQQDRDALLQANFLVEETTRLNDDAEQLPEEVRTLVRQPVHVDVTEGLKRSIFVDNVGLSVGDVVDLLRGDMSLEQVATIFRTVSGLFKKLHSQGWVHLGLTPWNVRIYDEARDDGFPQTFLADAFNTRRGKEDGEDEEGEDEQQQIAADQAQQDQSEDSGEEDSFSSGREKTVVELKPLGKAARAEQKAGDESGSDESPGSDDEPDTMETSIEMGAEDSDEELAALDSDAPEPNESLAVQDTAVAEDEASEPPQQNLQAIFDGIDRLFPAGNVEDEIAVTPGFSAPELLSGMGSEDGESADIFSLGMFLYFLVAGAVPPASVYTRYAPAIPARNFRPGFPPGLQSVISRATRPQPEERFARVETMVEAFEDAVAVMEKRQNTSPENAPVMEVASDTHIGIAKKQRNPTNQDSAFSACSDDDRFSLIVVADGVSTASYGSGDLASDALTEAAREVWDEVLPAYLMDEEFDETEMILKILRRANHTIVDYVNEHYTPFRGSPHEVMGSTALVALVTDGLVTLASLGDSRAYLQRGAGMEQITIDHNLWTLSILEGVEADSALAMPHGDALARCLGTFVVEDGELEAVDPEPDLFQFQVTDGDTLLLTTDGLVDFAGTNMLAAEDNILSVLLSEPNPALACLEFILLANRGGGGDNIGLSVARFY